MKKIFTLLSINFLLVTASQAQVKQNVLVEHFTNTRCGICGSRNPGLFTNLANNPDVLHIATHPSRPYSSCVLYQHNTTENDARTNYYGILGGTPRIVINGTVQSSGTGFTSSSLFTPFKTKMTPISIAVEQEKFGTDSIKATLTVKAVSAHTYTTALLYVPLVEDSLKYNAPNGEKLHHNVFRKSFYNSAINVPAKGDSIVLTYTLNGNTAWNFKQLKTMAFLQNTSDKSMIQAAEYQETKPTNTNSNVNITLPSFKVFPNPTTNITQINADVSGIIRILDINGKELVNRNFEKSTQVNLSTWNNGVYSIILETEKGTTQSKLLKL